MNTRITILLIVMAAFAVPSFGQRYYEEAIIEPNDGGGASYDLGTYLDNPCTAVYDWVFVDYNVYLEQDAVQLGAGSNRYLFDESTSMGGAYAATGASRSDVTYMTQPFTLRKYHKVNTNDAFHVVTVIDYDPASQQTYVSIETACGNGMPDSAQ
jgi:hypothetical protein